MSDGTGIEWTDATRNPVTGCSVVSPGCTNCYAMRLAGTRLRDHASRKGLTRETKAGPVWTGETRLNVEWLDQPLRWRKPRRIFVCAHGDLFHDSVPDEWIDRVFAVMALAPRHTFQVLTKRPDRMRAYVSNTATPGLIARQLIDQCLIDRAWPMDAARWPVRAIGDIDDPDDVTIGWPLPNVWLGTSVEDQRRADDRIPHLLATPAAVRFISLEPLLGAVDLMDIPWPPERPKCPETDDISDGRSALHLVEGSRLDWVIVGGESGPGARPMHPHWARSIRDQCAAAGVTFFFKQWGDWLPDFEEAAGRPDDNPEQSRFETCVWNAETAAWDRTNGGWDEHENWATATDYWQAEQTMTRVGKRAAGRLLEGETHDGVPA